MRSKKAIKNTVYGLIYEAAVMICGFVVPRLILTSFGSEYNGVTNVITQFLRVIALFQAGIGGVTLAALYKPLYEKDHEQVSVIKRTTEIYLRKIAFMFIGVSVIIACTLPLFVKEFDYLFTASLVLIMSLSTFAQYFFGQAHQFLLSADQRQRFMHGVNTVKVLANTVISAIMIKLGFGIHAVMLGSAVVYIIAPLFIYIYVNDKYALVKTVKPDNNVINQRWDNFGIEIANFTTRNSALIILSIFTNVYEVSVYSIYYLIMQGIFAIFSPFVNGVSAAFGNMFAKNEQKLLYKNLRLYEQIVFTLATFLFGVGAVIILPFVNIYVKGVSDVNYIRPMFAYIFLATTFFQSIRYPYTGITVAAGHFRPMRNPAFIEAILNIGISIVLVNKFGIVGVVVGTLFAYVYRTIRYAVYVSRVVLSRNIMIFIKRIILSLSCIFLIVASGYFLPFQAITNYLTLISYVAIISSIAIILIIIIELLFYKDDFQEFMILLRNIKKNKTNRSEEIPL